MGAADITFHLDLDSKKIILSDFLDKIANNAARKRHAMAVLKSALTKQ